MHFHRTWLSPDQSSPAPDLVRAAGDSFLLARILVNRGITNPASAAAFLSPDRYSPAPAGDLPDMSTAVRLLNDAIAEGWPVLIWGDFDVDGQTATALLMQALGSLGADVRFYIPQRLRESHGVRVSSLTGQIELHRPRLLLTCDTGVSAHDAVDLARGQGIATIITDHHDLPEHLPAADAVINPKRLPAEHPLADLPGVGVAFKLVEALFASRGQSQSAEPYLDLAALGIVADVARQRRDTRYLLQRGLRCLRDTTRAGLQMLCNTAGFELADVDEDIIAFQIAPRLNAAGRLGDAAIVVDLLSTTDRTQANLLALQLEGLNNQRKLLNRHIYQAAEDMIARDPSVLEWDALVLFHEDWHAGIIGIVASQLAEHYARPVVLLVSTSDGHARGSARAIPGYDIGAALSAVSDLLSSHGGHPGAAGLALPVDNIPAFRRRLSDALKETRSKAVEPSLQIDATIDLEAVTEDFARSIQRLAPFGEGNPPVTFAANQVHLKSAALIGRDKAHRRLTVRTASGFQQQVLWWNGARFPLPQGVFDLAFQVGTSAYQGEREIQLTLIDYREAETDTITMAESPRQVIDLRNARAASQALHKTLERYPQALVWADGYLRDNSPGAPLHELTPAVELVVYTAPASPRLLKKALDLSTPRVVILIAVDPPRTTLPELVRRFLQLTKHVITHQDGITTLDDMAGALAVPADTVERLYEYVRAQGIIDFSVNRKGKVEVSEGSQERVDRVPEIEEELQATVAEIRAYRAYFRTAGPYSLLGWDETT